MMKHEIVFDLETKNSFFDVGSRSNFADLGVSVLGAYSYERDSLICFEEAELGKFEDILRGASRVVGFNIKHFDYQVLQPHMKALSLKALPTLDLMEELAATIGYRPKLDDLAKGTLGRAKSGQGLEAIKWYREGKMDELKKYCLDDVEITRELYEFGAKHGYLMLESDWGKSLAKIPVAWEKLDPEPITQHSLF